MNKEFWVGLGIGLMFGSIVGIVVQTLYLLTNRYI